MPHFQDSDGDGIGDLGGINQRIDYLEQLGISALVLSPIFAASLRDGEFDPQDFMELEPRFGKVQELANLAGRLRACGIKLIIEYCPLYTSDQHTWFEQERQDRYGSASDKYVWKPSAEGDEWAWDEVRESYYLFHGRRTRPVLNSANQRLSRYWQSVLNHWGQYGVDGIRSTQDGVVMFAHSAGLSPYSVSLPNDTHGEAMRTIIDESSRIDANGDAHIYLRHTLGSSYDAANSFEKSRLLTLVQLTLRGLPQVQYGQELGYSQASLIMPWNNDNEAGFTKGTAWMPISPEAYRNNVHMQYADPESTLSLAIHLLQLRKNSPALRHGDYHSIQLPDRDVFAFVRETELQRIFVVANLSAKKKIIHLSPRVGAWVAGSHLAMGDGLAPSGKPVSLAPYEGRVYEAMTKHGHSKAA